MDWSTENKLHLNDNKTKELIIDFRKLTVDHKSLSINGTVLERVDILKFLRVHLSWTLHISTSRGPTHSNHHLFTLLPSGRMYQTIQSLRA